MAWPARIAATFVACTVLCSSTVSAQKNSTKTTSTKSVSTKQYPVKSGIRPWVDPNTPADRHVYISSRGRPWELTMSDEFNVPNRDFRPGKDHIWTSLEKPDGVNGAKEIYSHNMTSTQCDDDGTCYYYIKVIDDPQTISVYNMYLNPPQFEKVEFQYRAAMVQSWNKFCYQGGMLEVRAQLPGAISSKSGNPDLAKGASGWIENLRYYPTWPGIWMMGNLGRAIFSASTNRMWPFSYNNCDPDVFEPSNQRISACDPDPGYGMHPNHGRGAPEIDLVEGGGNAVSSSLQIAPGMPPHYRLFNVDTAVDPPYCLYSATCKTPGANHPGAPSALYNKRGHKSWYQGLRYQSNPFCAPDAKLKQNYQTVSNTVKAGIVENSCTPTNCPGSKDPNADLGLVDGNGTTHWGINYNGTCFPIMNAYMGSYLCDPDNQNKLCKDPRPDSRPKSNIMKPFNYQMDAISSNWPLHVAAYTDYLVYQVEWVTGKNGYVRWNLDGHPLFEITAQSFEQVPQDAKKSNPQKIMIEEPMYIIFNVALSTSWGATPPNPGKPCRGDGKDPITNKICDEFPMYLKIDYVRLYQDMGDNLEADNYMQLGCDPPSHPTKEWINGHIEEYQDYDNLAIDVAGGAFCTIDEDCTVLATGDIQYTRLVTGSCVNQRCVCTNSKSWGGPRCTFVVGETRSASGKNTMDGYGPPFGVAVGVASLAIVVTMMSLWWGKRNEYALVAAANTLAAKKATMIQQSPQEIVRSDAAEARKANYSQNFV